MTGSRSLRFLCLFLIWHSILFGVGACGSTWYLLGRMQAGRQAGWQVVCPAGAGPDTYQDTRPTQKDKAHKKRATCPFLILVLAFAQPQCCQEMTAMPFRKYDESPP